MVNCLTGKADFCLDAFAMLVDGALSTLWYYVRMPDTVPWERLSVHPSLVVLSERKRLTFKKTCRRGSRMVVARRESVTCTLTVNAPHSAQTPGRRPRLPVGVGHPQQAGQ